jgi:hypothetical protein
LLIYPTCLDDTGKLPHFSGDYYHNNPDLPASSDNYIEDEASVRVGGTLVRATGELLHVGAHMVAIPMP